jgi:hypothetical protein
MSHWEQTENPARFSDHRSRVGFPVMALSKEEALKKARQDMAQRLGISESDIEGQGVEDTDFPDTALGAGTRDEMSGQMITPGWRIRLRSGGQTLEYRANKHQVRLHNYKNANYKL